MRSRYFWIVLFCIFAISCQAVVDAPPPTLENRISADILSVTSSGTENAYTFAVEIKSPDTGCEQYADWWEVVSEEGELLYRRILAHSHVDEQPFIRSGGTIPIIEIQPVWIRAHMNTGGYGDAFYGSVSTGFTKQVPQFDFAKEAETIEPLPTSCAF